MNKSQIFLTFLTFMLILAVWLSIRLVPGLQGLSNPNSLAIGSGFALIFAFVCFLPVILLADVAGIIFARVSENHEDRRKVLWVLIIGNSLISLITVMSTLNSIIINSREYGAAAVFRDVSEDISHTGGLLQSVLMFLVPTLVTLFLCVYWLLKIDNPDDNRWNKIPADEDRQDKIKNSTGKEPLVTAPSGGEVQITKTEFSKLTYRQKYTVTEYGYLLSPKDAEIVGKMLGNFQEKDIPPFCEATGKKVSSFEQ